jgi:glycosyltransferase involved in cell wall biosynthesis
MNPKKKFKILFIPAGTKIAPATRYRVYEMLPFLEKEGISYKIYSIFSEGITWQMINSSTFGTASRVIYYIRIIIEKFIRAWGVIFLAGRFDLVFLQRATLPLGLERLLRLRNKNIIFDIDDSIYLPDKEEGGLIGWVKKFVKKKEVVSVLRVAKCVIAENNYIKNFVQKYCKEVYVITGPIDTVKNFTKETQEGSGEVTIGWIGTPSTTPYLKMLDNVFQQLHRKYNIRVMLIGAAPYSIDGVEVQSISWNEKTEVQELHKFDIGVMSMPDNEWTRGKVGCKMLQYMANAIPSVVSYTPTTAEVIENGINGFLASSEEEWIEKLSSLIENPQLRDRIGRAGRQTAEERFAINVNMSRYIEIFKSCIR